MNQIYFFRKKVLAKKYFLEKSINKKYPQKVLTKNLKSYLHVFSLYLCICVYISKTLNHLLLNYNNNNKKSLQ